MIFNGGGGGPRGRSEPAALRGKGERAEHRANTQWNALSARGRWPLEGHLVDEEARGSSRSFVKRSDAAREIAAAVTSPTQPTLSLPLPPTETIMKMIKYSLFAI